MPTQHIDFKHIRQHAMFTDVAAYYNITLQKDGTKDDQFKGLCPFHEDHEPSLKVNTTRNLYHCFVCDAGGNIIDFVMGMEESDLRSAAKKVAEISNIEVAEGAPKSTKPRRATKGRQHKRSTKATSGRGPEVAANTNTPPAGENVSNQPLTFELKNLVTDHPYLTERGISEPMRAEFGIGVATRGIMQRRLVFPIHNTDGELVAYCGRYIGDDPPEDEPKYKQPPKFRKELELFNWHRAKEMKRDNPLVMVESFFSVVKLHCSGLRCISPMGRSLSQQQLQLLLDANEQNIILLLDGDDPGRAAVATIGRRLLAAGIRATAPVVPEEFKPHRCNAEQIVDLLRII